MKNVRHLLKMPPFSSAAFTHPSARLSDAHVRVRADVSQDGVHAEQSDARADARVVLVGHCVEERDATAALQYAVVGGGEEAVGKAVPVEERIAMLIFSFVDIFLFCLLFLIRSAEEEDSAQKISFGIQFPHLIFLPLH